MEQDCKSCSTLLAQNAHNKSCSTSAQKTILLNPPCAKRTQQILLNISFKD